MQERRQYKRHIVILPTKLETILTPGEKKVFDVETRNISIGGAFIPFGWSEVTKRARAKA